LADGIDSVPIIRPMKSVLLMSLLAFALPAAAMFKCQSPDGKTTFQEIPCAATQQQSAVRIFASPPAAATPQDARSPAERSAINVALLHGYPVRGMTLGELQTAMGEPTRINAGDYEGGFTEQRVYQRGNGTFYVYTDNGMVRAIQTTGATARAPAGAPPAAAQGRACPSAADIKNEEVSANSISLSEDQRRARQRQVANMRACR
jgi:hypothetical protein